MLFTKSTNQLKLLNAQSTLKTLQKYNFPKKQQSILKKALHLANFFTPFGRIEPSKEHHVFTNQRGKAAIKLTIIDPNCLPQKKHPAGKASPSKAYSQN